MKENKLIAEFWGMVLGDDGTMYYDDAENLFPPTPPDKLEFHEDWNWLIPVVKKCWESGAEEDEVGDITHAYLDCDRKETHKAVVEFIKQLNKEL